MRASPQAGRIRQNPGHPKPRSRRSPRSWRRATCALASSNSLPRQPQFELILRCVRALIAHNTGAYLWGRSLPCFGEIVTHLHGILERFLNAVGCLDACLVADETLENLPLPTQVGKTKVGGMDFNKPRMRRVADAVLALSTAPTGFTASELAQKVRAMICETVSSYGPVEPDHFPMLRRTVPRVSIPIRSRDGQCSRRMQPNVALWPVRQHLTVLQGAGGHRLERRPYSLLR